MADAPTREPVDRLAQELGIVGSYTDQLGRRRRTSRATKVGLLRAMGIAEDEIGDALAEIAVARRTGSLPPCHVCHDGTPPALSPDTVWSLVLENGTAREGRGPLPVLPLGLHALDIAGAPTTLIACPRRLPKPARGWGVMLPLHALRSAEEGGLATFGDLSRAGCGLARHRADFIGLNPIHAGFWGAPEGFSPYTPSHRRRLCSFYVAADQSTRAGASLVDFAREIPARRAALEAAFASFGGAADFDRFKAAGGAALRRFALHQALSDLHGPFWSDWPAELRDPDAQAVSAAARGLAAHIDFHLWLQWRAETDLANANAEMRAAGMRTGLYLDLAVGTHPYGAETWEDRESFAFGASLGAPPDAFSADGQSWGLAPFNPHALVAKGFAPLAETLRRQLQVCGALRIDHILGIDRAFWVPEGGAPGAYVRMPRDAMLAVLRLEAARAGAVIVGEDLGNVPRGLRAALTEAGVLTCQVQIFERGGPAGRGFRPPDDYSERAVASFSTHDLPTWSGWRAGHDITTHRALGHIDERQARDALADRAADVAAFDAMTANHRPGDTPPESVDAMHHALASTRSALALVQVENMLGVTPQPNLPGTVREYPNWRQRLPVGAAALAAHPGTAAVAAIMTAHDRTGGSLQEKDRHAPD